MRNPVTALLVCLVAGPVLGATPAGFSFPTGDVALMPGSLLEIPISVTTPGTIQGMSLYVESSGAPFEIQDLLIDNAGTVWTFPGTSTGATVFTYGRSQASNDGQITHPYYAAAYVTASSQIAVVPGDRIAVVRVLVPWGPPFPLLGSLSTVSHTWGDIPSDFVEPAAQATIRLIPEPAAALLAWAGAAGLARRTARRR